VLFGQNLSKSTLSELWKLTIGLQQSKEHLEEKWLNLHETEDGAPSKSHIQRIAII